MTYIDIFSGFLGAGKTTLIKKLIKEAYAGEKIVLVENEFGEIGIDGGFLADSGIQINELNSGCICCSLVGDFEKALNEVVERYAPSRIVIEPSGVGKLSDVIRAVQTVESENIRLNGTVAVVDAKKCKMYMKNFGEFFNDQIEHASAVVLSHSDAMSDEKLSECVALIREHNADASVVVTPWAQLDGKQIVEAMEKKSTLETELKKLLDEEDVCPVCHHHHDDDEHDHDHDHDHDEHECHHHHHDDDDDDNHDDGHDHHHDDHHHDDHDEHECCHHHDDEGHHHHHHHADEVFTSWGVETNRKYSEKKLGEILASLQDQEKYGMILRSKGIVASDDSGEWIHFDYVPGEPDVRRGSAGVIGRICVIGSAINEKNLSELFEI